MWFVLLVFVVVVVVVVVGCVAAAVLKMQEDALFSGTTFGSRCFNKSHVIFRFVSDFKAFLIVVPCWKCFPQ